MITFKVSMYDYDLITKKFDFDNFDAVAFRHGSAHCTVSEDQAVALIDRLGTELVENGFQSNDEPNAHGYRIEALIDIVGDDLSN